VTPVLGIQHFVGATFDKSRENPLVTDEDQVANLARAARILPALFGADDDLARSAWAGVRCASRDRLPVIGEVDASVACCIAMGSRGFSWSPLAGEAVASLVAGTPAPLERSILQRLSAGRFGVESRAGAEFLAD
jgi:tRNA 5-methylaminomethyl-2-thiouridine biosynthesis bifunctional protein